MYKLVKIYTKNVFFINIIIDNINLDYINFKNILKMIYLNHIEHKLNYIEYNMFINHSIYII